MNFHDENPDDYAQYQHEQGEFYAAIEKEAQELAALDGGPKEVINTEIGEVFSLLMQRIEVAYWSPAGKDASFIRGFKSVKGTYYFLISKTSK